MECLPTLKCRSLRTTPAAEATPASTSTMAVPAAILLVHMSVPLRTRLLFSSTAINCQIVEHLLLPISVDQQLLRVNIIGVASQRFFGVPDERIGLSQVGPVRVPLRRRTSSHRIQDLLVFC